MKILIDCNELEHRKKCIISSIAKIASSMSEPDIHAINILLKQHDDIKKLQELAISYCKV